jgi:hypothetical protein
MLDSGNFQKRKIKQRRGPGIVGTGSYYLKQGG